MPGAFIYTLGGPDGKTPVPCFDSLEWDKWLGKSFQSRVVRQEDVGECWVSTVFLGIDHGLGGGGRPMLFETMVFRGSGDEDQERCSTWAEAEVQHRKAVERVRRGTPEPRVAGRSKKAADVVAHRFDAANVQRKLLE